MITFQIEKLDQFLESAFPLFDNHYQEVVEKTDVIKLNPNLDVYYILEKKNILEIHTARDDEKLIGYSMWIVNQHINFKDSLTANSDSLYVSPEYRKGMFGAKFIKFCGKYELNKCSESADSFGRWMNETYKGVLA